MASSYSSPISYLLPTDAKNRQGRITHEAVVVRVDHDRRSASEVDVLLPPVGYVVSRPPGLE